MSPFSPFSSFLLQFALLSLSLPFLFFSSSLTFSFSSSSSFFSVPPPFLLPPIRFFFHPPHLLPSPLLPSLCKFLIHFILVFLFSASSYLAYSFLHTFSASIFFCHLIHPPPSTYRYCIIISLLLLLTHLPLFLCLLVPNKCVSVVKSREFNAILNCRSLPKFKNKRSKH
jgi:hypothetical protein